MVHDFASGHGDDLEAASAQIVPNISPSGQPIARARADRVHLLISGKKPEGAAVVAAYERLVRADAARDGLANVIAATRHERQAAAA